MHYDVHCNHSKVRYVKSVTYANLYLPTPCMLIDFPPKIDQRHATFTCFQISEKEISPIRTPIFCILPGLGTPVLLVGKTVPKMITITLQFSDL